MNTICSVFSIGALLATSIMTIPPQTTIVWGIEPGDVFTWEFTNVIIVNGTVKENNTIPLPMHLVWLSGSTDNYVWDVIYFEEIYIGERISINITSVPNQTNLEQNNSNYPGVYPTGWYYLPRSNGTANFTPYIFKFQFFVPIDTVMGENHPGCLYNDQGVLRKQELTYSNPQVIIGWFPQGDPIVTTINGTFIGTLELVDEKDEHHTNTTVNDTSAKNNHSGKVPVLQTTWFSEIYNLVMILLFFLAFSRIRRIRQRP